jgi:hypothetical protein
LFGSSNCPLAQLCAVELRHHFLLKLAVPILWRKVSRTVTILRCSVQG